MKILFVALLVLVSSFTAALIVAGVDPKNDDIELLKDRILGANRKTFTYGNSTYEVSLFEEEWAKAKYYCKWLGMELVSIESSEENAAITTTLGDSTFHYYLMSLNDYLKDGDYYWESTGQLLGSYNEWYGTNPVLGATNCAVLGTGDTTSPLKGKWQSVNCSYEFAYICEKDNLRC